MCASTSFLMFLEIILLKSESRIFPRCINILLRFLKILQFSGRLDLYKILIRSYERQAYSWPELGKVEIRSAPVSAQILTRGSIAVLRLYDSSLTAFDCEIGTTRNDTSSICRLIIVSAVDC